MCCALSHTLGPQAMAEVRKLLHKKSFCSLPLPLATPNAASLHPEPQDLPFS